MPTVADVVQFVFEIAPDPRSPEQTENGLQFGDAGANVSRIAVMWRVTPELLDQAGQSGASLAVGHEPLFYPTTGNYWWGQPAETDDKPINIKHRALLEQYAMAYARFHSNIDVVREWGQPAEMLRVLGFEDCPTEWNIYVPMAHVPAIRVSELAALCQERLGLSHVRVTGDLDKTVSKLAVCWGGLSRNDAGIDCALHMGADCILGGDLTDAAALDADAADLPVIECGHAHSEMPAMRVLAEKLDERFDGVEVKFLPNSEPWVVYSS